MYEGEFSCTFTTSLPKELISDKNHYSGKVTQVPMFTSKTTDIAVGDTRSGFTHKVSVI